jgi:O-antigen/teichoic acid export membrane protein
MDPLQSTSGDAQNGAPAKAGDLIQARRFDKFKYLRNIAFNWGAYITSIAIGFLMAPFVVRNLGDAQYGFWTLILTTTTYFARLDLGIQSAVGQYISRHLADKDSGQLNDKANSALTALLGVGFLVVLASVGLSFVFPRFFNVPSDAETPVRLALVLMGLVAAARLPFSVFQAILIGRERFDLMSGISTAVRIINASLVFLILQAKQGLAGMAIVLTCLQFLEGALLVFFAGRAVPQIRIRLFFFKPNAFKELLQYGSFNFIINLCSHFGNGFWAVILARKLGADPVTYFSIGYEVVPYMVGVANAAILPLLQSLIPMDVHQDSKAIRAMFLTGSRYFFSLICLMAINLLLVGQDFIGQWMGAKYLQPEPYGSSGTVLLILTLANAASLSSLVAQQILFARRSNKRFALFTLLQTLGIVVLGIVLVPTMGIQGMAISMLVPMVLVEGLLIPFLAARQAHSRIAEYWLHAILPNVVLAAVLYGLGRLVLPHIHWDGWISIFLSFGIVTVAHLASVLLFILTREHRLGLLAHFKSRF